MSAILPGHGLPPTGLGGINLQPQGNVQVPQGQQQAPQGVGPARQGAGALAGRQIQVGDGQPRDTSLGLADKARNFFKTGAKVLAGIVLAPVMIPLGLAGLAAVVTTRALLQIPRLINQKLLEPASDRRFENANPALAQLRQPLPGGILSTPGVMERLTAHAARQGTPMTAQQIQDMVATGERLADALHNGPGGSPVTVQVNGQPVPVDSSVHTARALSWYMMAAAAQQDVQREQSQDHSTIGGQKVTDMPASGSFVMKDPGNRVYDFLAAAPTADSRMSTHFGERVDHNEQHKIAGLIPSGKPSQRGIEDYRNMLPGQGGTILFDKLAASNGTQDLFVKFESGGCPPYFRTEPHQGTGQGIARFFSALDRNIGHATSFLGSKFQGGADEMRRQEHIYKGTLKEDVAKPFARLVDHAIAAGTIDASAKAVGNSVHKFGLPFIKEALDHIQDAATQHNDTGTLREVMAVRQQIAEATAKLGAQSDHFGIERRGAEAHISVNPQDNRPQVLPGELRGPAAQAFARAVVLPSTARDITTATQHGICNQADKDWPRATVTIGGQTILQGNAVQSAALLNGLAGGDAHLTMLVSQYANQQTLAPLMESMMRGELGIQAPDGSPGMPEGHGVSHYTMVADPAGGIRLTLDYARPNVHMVNRLDGSPPIPVDPAQSHATFSFSLHIAPAPGYGVTLAEPVRYNVQLRS